MSGYSESATPEVRSHGIGQFFKSYKRLWWVSAVCAVVLALLSFAYYTLTFEPRYNSNVKFTITPLVSGNVSDGANIYAYTYNGSFAGQMAETFPYIINSGIMSDMITIDLNRKFDASVSATAVADTNIFEINVSSTSAQDAYDVIMSVMANYPKVAEYVIGDTRMNIIEGSEPVVATEPYNSGYYYKNIAVFALFGVLIGLVAAYIDMVFRKVVSTKQDIIEQFDAKCLCEIPSVVQKRGAATGTFLRAGMAASGFSESLRALKLRVQAALNADGKNTVGIISAVDGDGKTTVAYNLARSLSSGNKRVLLIDADFINRAIQNGINRKKGVPDTGLTDIVTGRAEMGDCIKAVSETFHILFAGTQNIKFRKERYQPIFDFLKQHYDYIIVDMPACYATADAVQIGDLCDELLFVVRSNTLSPDRIKACLKDIAFSEAKLMGFVLNAQSSANSRSDSAYNYGSYYSSEQRRSRRHLSEEENE